MANLNLDNPKIYEQLDPAGMLARIRELPWQCQKAWQEAMAFDLPAAYSGVNKIVILGMGGSAIGGDLARGLAAAEAKVPIFMHRDYTLPPFVDARTLVIASSYSGNTEETLSSFEQALGTRARKLVMTTGGKLQAIAREKGIPLFTFGYKAQPRAALGFSLLPLLCFLQKLGVISDKSADVAGMIRTLEEMCGKLGNGVATAANPAKQMAERLYGNLPVVYGADLLADVARRWKGQVNENSKAWAFFEVLPEMNHNAVVGYQFPKELLGKIKVIMLRSSYLHTRVQLRYRITGELLDRVKVSHEAVDGVGDSPLSQVMSLVLFGDYVSYYLALLYQVDPSPVEVINYLKAELAKG